MPHRRAILCLAGALLLPAALARPALPEPGARAQAPLSTDWELFVRGMRPDEPEPVCPKLSLICRRRSFGDWVELRPMDQRFRDKGYATVVRFGARTESSPSRWEVQIGGILNNALFLAALILFLL